ncbi:glycosyltransferase family protein [Alcanivorax quisquiliarum]|uniref:Glycosyltransferase n=1 Tax=Alcanivorax quisquiliarum TaxID=2933565 RepID=A0ABT0EAB4_9GAMM|nr:glycosyltransferase [Alcanivorax quisquiliarum]MCK0538744.1 glycosyltransferase [Alcanivorax quisquiliarum]
MPVQLEVSRVVVPDEAQAVQVLAGLVGGHGYDRVVVDANLRRMGADVKRLRGIVNLVIFDFDMCQENVPASSWYRCYVPVLKYISPVKVLTSSACLMAYFRQRGIAAELVCKGYDPEVIRNERMERDIPAAFVGRISHKVYRERRTFLESAVRKNLIKIMRAEPGAAYNQLLNRIRVFVSADVGFNEYMIKNFEAMAAGCLLLAWRQPEAEQQALGFEEGRHLLMYESLDELQAKLAWVRERPDDAEKIAEAGSELVCSMHRWESRASAVAAAIEAPGGVPDGMLGFKERLRLMRI